MMMKTHCTLLHTEDASQWCTYVKKLFTKDARQNLKIDSINVEELDYENPPQLAMAVKTSYLVVLLASPDMKTYMLNKSSWFQSIVNNVPEGTSLAVLLCYVSAEEFRSSIKESYSVLADKKCDVIGSDPRANTNIVADYIDIIDKNEHQSRKPTPKQRKKHVPASGGPIVKEITPTKVIRAKEHVLVACSIPLEGTLQVGFVGDSELHETKSINPYTFRFKSPNKPPGSYRLQIFQDGKEIHQQPFYYMTPCESAFQSVGYLQQVFKVKDKEGLDDALVDIMERSLTEDGSLTFLFEKIQNSILAGGTKSAAEIPTLLHFAAANGLSEFCSFLLDVPGSVVAFQMENSWGLNPAELAENRGHMELAEYIRDFMETKAVLTTCDMYIKMTDTETGYMKMGPVLTSFEDTYCTPIEINKFGAKPGVVPPPKTAGKPKSRLPPIPARARSSSDCVRPESEKGVDETKSKQAADFMGLSAHNTTSCPTALGMSNQEQLVQIMESVKKGDFNTDDALMLFKDWKEKNMGEESNSFKKKKENLKRMRKNYSKIWLATEATADEVYQKSGANILQRMLSKKGTKKRQPQISEPYQTRTQHVFKCVNESERYSSSSNSSRDSNASSASDIEQNDEYSPVVTRRSSTSPRTNGNQNCRKTMFLELTNNVDGECPPLPPRTYIRR